MVFRRPVARPWSTRVRPVSERTRGHINVEGDVLWDARTKKRLRKADNTSVNEVDGAVFSVWLSTNNTARKMAVVPSGSVTYQVPFCPAEICWVRHRRIAAAVRRGLRGDGRTEHLPAAGV